VEWRTIYTGVNIAHGEDERGEMSDVFPLSSGVSHEHYKHDVNRRNLRPRRPNDSLTPDWATDQVKDGQGTRPPWKRNKEGDG
jgi:hypothetical protein